MNHRVRVWMRTHGRNPDFYGIRGWKIHGLSRKLINENLEFMNHLSVCIYESQGPFHIETSVFQHVLLYPVKLTLLRKVLLRLVNFWKSEHSDIESSPFAEEYYTS